MKEGLRSSGVMVEDINNVHSGSEKVNGVVKDNSCLGLENIDDKVVGNGKKNNMLDIDLNQVTNENNELISSDLISLQFNGEGSLVDGDLNEVAKGKNEQNSGVIVSVPMNGESSLVNGDVRSIEMDIVSNEADCANDSVGGLLDNTVEKCEENVVITSEPGKKLGKVYMKRRKTKSNDNEEVNVNADSDMVATVPNRKQGRPLEKKMAKSTADTNLETAVVKSGPKTQFGKLPVVKGKATSESKGKLNADLVIDTAVCKKKPGRPPKERRMDDNDDANVETAVVTSGPGIRYGKLPNKKGKAMNTFKGKVGVNVDSDKDTIVPRKRGRPPKERKEENSVEEKVRDGAGVGKGGDVDSDCDEEAVVGTVVGDHGDGHTPKLKVEKGRRGRKRKMVESSVGDHGDGHTPKLKVEKGRRGRKRKMVESSVGEMENGAFEKKAKEPSSNGEFEGIGRVLRSRSVMRTSGERDNMNESIMEAVGKMEKESAHLSGRQNQQIKRSQGRPPKVQGKRGPLKIHGGEKLKKTGAKPSSRKVIKGSTLEEDRSSDCEAEKVVLDQPNTKKNKKNKKEGKRRSTQQQLIKDRIRDMLFSAGWTIDYRPRNGREFYHDAVYVSPKGSGYWSVTLAYRILKKQVEDGKADSRAVSAFVPLPENEWNILLRKTKNKLDGVEDQSSEVISEKESLKEVKDQSSKVISRKKILEKKQSEKKDRSRAKHKEALKKSNGKERNIKKKFTLLARGSKKGSNVDGEDFLLYEGKRSLLSWMIDLGTLSLGVKVKYMNSRKSRVLLEGKVTKDGIHCDCCSKTFDLVDFEIHSGSSFHQPLQNICLDSKTSLLQCLKDSWSKYGESMSLGFHSVNVDSADPNDDTCNICGDGGKLICCDSCPSAIHQKCLNIEEFPSGDWNCIYCSCKFCGMVGESTLDEDQNCVSSGLALPTCRLCEETYHLQCVQEKDTPQNKPNSPTFCSESCQKIFEQLKELFGVKHQMEEGFSWTLLQHSDDNLEISSTSGAKRIECNAKLAVAWAVMDECFVPIVDQRSGINMIRSVIHSCGSNIRRLSYTGFFVVILEKGDEIISAASLRIHGNLLAEMPFIGTRYTYRRQGMCRRLLTAVETALCSLNVEKLVLPAVSEVRETWTSVFGFMPLEESHKKEMKCMNVIAFPGVVMLYKPVVLGAVNRSSATEIKSSGVGVAVVDNATSQVPNVSLNEPSYITSELVSCQDSGSNDENGSRKEDIKQVSASHCEHSHVPNEINEHGNVPFESCNVASNGSSKLKEQELVKVADINGISETVSDSIDCETKSAHISDVKDIVNCVLNGEVNGINHSRDQHVANDHGTSTQALVLV